MRRVIIIVVWLVGAGAAFAQQQPPKFSISASLIDAWLIRGTVCCQSNPSLPTTGIGGSAVGGVFGFDVAASRHVGIDAELSVQAYASDYQEAVKYHSRVRQRDTILSGLLRFRLRPGSAVDIEPVGGAGVSFADTWSSTSYLQFTPAMGYTPFGDYVQETRGHVRPVVTGGVDVPIWLGRIAIVPTIRIHYIFREEVMRDQVGLGSWSIRPGIGVRIGF